MTNRNFPPQFFSEKDGVILNKDNYHIPNFTFKENNKRYNAENPKKLAGCRLKIDGAFYDSTNGKKCDNGLLLEDNRFYLIELKGDDVNKGCQQLLNTLALLEKDCPKEKFDFYCRIIGATGVPKNSVYRLKLEKILHSTSKNKKFISGVNNFSEKV